MTEPLKALIAPTGARILGTLETLSGTAVIFGATLAPVPGAKFEIHYQGSTEVDWNSQHTATRAGQRLFIDENHQLWQEDDLTLGQPI